MRLYLLYIFLAFASLTASAQADRQHIRGGNRLYKAKQWAEAEVEYRKALAANAQNPQPQFATASPKDGEKPEAVKWPPTRRALMAQTLSDKK